MTRSTHALLNIRPSAVCLCNNSANTAAPVCTCTDVRTESSQNHSYGVQTTSKLTRTVNPQSRIVAAYLRIFAHNIFSRSCVKPTGIQSFTKELKSM
jgi:hypothetical protein